MFVNLLEQDQINRSSKNKITTLIIEIKQDSDFLKVIKKSELLVVITVN